jgi:hypothetical protein
MELSNGFNPMRAIGAPPDSIGQSAGMKIWIDWHVIAKTLRRSKQGFELDLLHGLLGPLLAFGLANGVEDLRVSESC